MDTLTMFSNCDEKEEMIQLIRTNIENASGELKEIQQKLNCGSDFTIVDYERIQKTFSFQRLTGEFFDKFKGIVTENISKVASLEELDAIEFDIAAFCRTQNLEERMGDQAGRIVESENHDDNDDDFDYISSDILGEDEQDESFSKIKFDRMLRAVQDVAGSIIQDDSKADFLVKGSQEYELYFKNVKLKGDAFRSKTLAIIDDLTKTDLDIFITSDGVVPVKHSKVDKLHRLDKIGYQGKSLKLGWPYEYSNNAVNMGNLYNLLETLKNIRNK